MLSRALILRASGLRPVERMVRRWFIFRPLVRRFIAGDTLDEALQVSESLLKRDLRVTLDYLGENTRSEAEARTAVGTYIAMLEAIPKALPGNAASVLISTQAAARTPLPASEPLNISIKLTQCGLDQGESFCELNLREVLACALDKGNFVRLDMEGSAYTEATLTMLERVLPDFPNTGAVLQSYLYRTDEDVERIIRLNARCRIVKGAYLEHADVAYEQKSKVDEAYVRHAKRLLESAFYPAIATQDAAIIAELNRFIAEKQIDKSRFEYQMLYGIRRDLQESLVADGFNVRIYVPFGESWYPYFSRRLAERPANVWFIMKAAFGR
ncbi:MAG: proline dehydrogenase family protein [Fimbriimonadaceae bacterium]